MTYQEKYKAVVVAILEKPDPSYIELTIASDKNLKNKLTKSELEEILDELQYKEKVIIVSRPKRNPIIKGWEIDKITGESRPLREADKSYDFALKRLPEFENWYSAFLIRIKADLENLDKGKLKHLSLLVKAIENKFQNDKHPDIYFSMLLDCEGELKFLKDKSIVLKYRQQKTDEAGFRIHLMLDVNIFANFLPRFKNICLKRFKNPIINPTNIPPNTKWEDITIKFMNGNDVKIEAKSSKFDSDFKQMGFEDKKAHRPNKQWGLLKKLAEKGGTISWQSYPEGKNIKASEIEQNFGFEQSGDNDEAENKGFSYVKNPDSVKKTKEMLTKGLKAFFQIQDDPFYPYHKEKAYKIKIHLLE
jgi:hypothetical protein